MQYVQKDNLLYNMARIFLDQIKKAFIRFNRADSVYTLLKSNPDQIIVDRMVERYLNVCDDIKYGRFDYIFINREVSRLVQFYEAYVIMKYK